MKKLLITFIALMILACSSSDIEDALELIEGVDRKTIDTSRLGMNAFGNKTAFGSACEQYSDIKNTLKLNYLRLLLNWDDGLQASSGSGFNFGFIDSLLNCVQDGQDVLLVLTGVPSWFNSDIYIDGNPRKTFVELFLRPVFERYKNNSKIVAFQIFNEPNNTDFGDNTRLDVLNSPENFVELIALARSLKDELGVGKLMLNGATTGIAQNFEGTLNYNKALVANGILNFIDIFAIHYYGTNFENVITDGGVKDFINSLGKEVWITESGARGFNSQLEYAETVFPYLRDHLNGLNRIYYYQYASDEGSETAFGLRNLTTETSVSDLYVHLRDR